MKINYLRQIKLVRKCPKMVLAFSKTVSSTCLCGVGPARSRLGCSTHRGQSRVDTNMEPILKVIASVVLLYGPWAKRSNSE